MIEPLTAGWLQQLQEATAAIETDPSVNLVIQQTVSSDPPLTWHVAISGGSAVTVIGPVTSPDITLQSDHETAVGIATGRISARRAFLEGALRIAGRIDALLEAQAALQKIGDALWAVREAAGVTKPATATRPT